MSKKTKINKEPNLKGLGVAQLSLIYRMIKEDLVIRVIVDHDKRPTIELQSESGDDSYESIPLYIMRSFCKRKLLTYFGWMPALFITIDTYRIKEKVKELLLLNRIGTVQVSDTTDDHSSNAVDNTKNQI